MKLIKLRSWKASKRVLCELEVMQTFPDFDKRAIVSRCPKLAGYQSWIVNEIAKKKKTVDLVTLLI